MQRPFQLNASFWLAAIAYAVGGTSIFLSTSDAAPSFTNMDDCFPIPIRVVMYVGPFGWVPLVLIGAAATLCVPYPRWRLASTILVCLLAIGIMCTVMFTNIEHPSHISPSNERAGGKGGNPSLVAVEHAWSGLPEHDR
jgi:hypothetical protein